MAATTKNPKTIQGAAGKKVKIGAPCLALNDDGDLTPGKLTGVTDKGMPLFTPKTGTFNGKNTDEPVELKPKAIFPKWPLPSA